MEKACTKFDVGRLELGVGVFKQTIIGNRAIESLSEKFWKRRYNDRLMILTGRSTKQRRLRRSTPFALRR
jgi:hypothetical protein